jgi:surface protein
VLIGVPMKMTFRMPVGSLSATVGYTNAVRTNEFVIDWGDGNSGDQSNNTHTYGSDGDYTVRVFKNYDPNMQNTSYLLSVDQWGDFNHYLGGNAFSGCLNVDVLATDSCILHGTSLANCFNGCDSLANTNNSIGNWDVSTITNMNSMFFACDVFNADISQWVTTNVTDMGNMFMGAHYRGPYTIFNQDINTKLRSDGTLAWDTRNVITMNNMLRYNYSFDKDIGYWNTDKLENLGGFRSLYVGAFSWPNNDMSCKQVTLGTHTYIAWDTGSVTSFSSSFGGPINGGNANGISNWNTSSATSMNSMFGGGGTDDSSWDLSTRTVTVGTGATARTYTAWDTSLVTDMNGLFKSFANNNNAYIQGVSNWNTQNVEDISRMFFLFPTANVNLNNWNTTNLENASQFLWGSRSNPPQMDQSFSNWNMTSFTGSFTGWVDYYQVPAYNSSISVANYNATLTSWGAQSVNSGVTTNMGNSQYTATTVVQGTCNNTGTNNTNCNDYANSPFVTAGVQVGDIAYNVTTGQYSKVLSIVFTGTGITTDQAIWSDGDVYRVERSNAVKGRYALIQAGWTITDGGLYVPPITPLKFNVNVTTSTTNASLEFKIPFVTGTNFSINWGDGNTDTGLSSGNAAVSHTYSTAGTYPIEIGQAGDAGPPTKIAFGPTNGEVNNTSTPGNGAKAVTEITQWGSIQWTDVVSMWCGCTNLDTMSATDTPDLSNVAGTDGTKFMFGVGRLRDGFDAPSLSTVNSSINNWDVSSIRNFYYTFQRANSFNASINNWDISGIDQADGLINMFNGARLFNQSLSNWTLPSAVTSLAGMFASGDATNGFNQNIGHWDVSNIVNMSQMFAYAAAYTGIGLENWERTTAGNTSTVGSVTNMYQMFYYANKLTNTAISNWNTGQVTTFHGMFGRWGYPTAANPQIDVGNIVKQWDTSRAAQMGSMFTENRAINQNLGSINISSLTSAVGMFYRSNLMSSANYTDTIVGFAQFVKNQTPDAPLGVNFSNQQQVTYDTTRSASGFTPATAGRARSFLTLDVTVSGGTGVNGVYYYDYANDKWLKETDSTYVIEWNSGESSWELKYEGSTVNAGSGGTQVGGPESSTSWSGGLTVVDSSKGWSITADTIQ